MRASSTIIQTTPTSPLTSSSFYIFCKNGRINSDVRLSTLLAELSLIEWDFVCFSETRCLSQDVTLEGGHRLITSLSSPGASGVAILINAKYTKMISKKIIVSDRVISVDLKLKTKHLRLISVYVPHAGYSWDEFDDCMTDTGRLVMEAVDQNKHILIGGDFNLTLYHGDRGRYMQDFCGQHNLFVANSEGDDTDENVWTFKSSLGTLRRIDFILGSYGLQLENAAATRDIDLGSDHRTIKALFSFQ